MKAKEIFREQDLVMMVGLLRKMADDLRNPENPSTCLVSKDDVRVYYVKGLPVFHAKLQAAVQSVRCARAARQQAEALPKALEAADQKPLLDAIHGTRQPFLTAEQTVRRALVSLRLTFAAAAEMFESPTDDRVVMYLLVSSEHFPLFETDSVRDKLSATFDANNRRALLYYHMMRYAERWFGLYTFFKNSPLGLDGLVTNGHLALLRSLSQAAIEVEQKFHAALGSVKDHAQFTPWMSDMLSFIGGQKLHLQDTVIPALSQSFMARLSASKPLAEEVLPVPNGDGCDGSSFFWKMLKIGVPVKTKVPLPEGDREIEVTGKISSVRHLTPVLGRPGMEIVMIAGGLEVPLSAAQSQPLVAESGVPSRSFVEAARSLGLMRAQLDALKTISPAIHKLLAQSSTEVSSILCIPSILASASDLYLRRYGIGLSEGHVSAPVAFPRFEVHLDASAVVRLHVLVKISLFTLSLDGEKIGRSTDGMGDRDMSNRLATLTFTLQLEPQGVDGLRIVNDDLLDMSFEFNLAFSDLAEKLFLSSNGGTTPRGAKPYFLLRRGSAEVLPGG